MNRRLGRPCQGDAGETRLRILREARNAFTTRGYDNTTNREIAQGAGITAAAIYHYFPQRTLEESHENCRVVAHQARHERHA
ncbi:MAG: helix-turn-helix domain-containing protein [Actinomycetota bacterium]